MAPEVGLEPTSLRLTAERLISMYLQRISQHLSYRIPIGDLAGYSVGIPPNKYAVGKIIHLHYLIEFMQAQAARACLEPQHNLYPRPRSPIKHSIEGPSLLLRCRSAKVTPVSKFGFIHNSRL